MPISEQKLLFDHIREGEKVLHLLETITPTAFMEQCVISHCDETVLVTHVFLFRRMFGVVLTMIYNSLVCLPAAKLPIVRRSLADLHGYLEKMELEEIKYLHCAFVHS